MKSIGIGTSIVAQVEAGKSAAEHAQGIREAWSKSVAGILEAGRRIREAKESLEHGEFMAMATALPFSYETAYRLMYIAGDSRLNLASSQDLPASWYMLYHLALLSDAQFEQGMRDGIIRPDMGHADIVQLKGAVPHPGDAQRTPTVFSGFVADEERDASLSNGIAVSFERDDDGNFRFKLVSLNSPYGKARVFLFEKKTGAFIKKLVEEN